MLDILLHHLNLLIALNGFENLFQLIFLHTFSHLFFTGISAPNFNYCILCFFQINRKIMLGLQLEEKMHSHGCKLSSSPDMQTQLLQPDDNLMLIGISLHLCHQTAGIDHIDGEHTEEESDYKGKREII